MPPKIRVLKAQLRKAGFIERPGKGSHLVFKHPEAPEIEVSFSGHDGNDADPYQRKDVDRALEQLKRKRESHKLRRKR